MRERLIELLDETMSEQYEKRHLVTARHTADHLLANGVVVVDTNIVSAKNRPLITHIADYPIDEVIDLMEAKNAGRIAELPCAVGDKVYWINRSTKEVETDIVISIHRYEDGFSITTKTIGTKCTSTYSLDRFLEIMHFTKKEAKKALNERK